MLNPTNPPREDTDLDGLEARSFKPGPKSSVHGVQAVAVESRRTSDYWLRILTQTQGAPSSPEAMPLHTPKADPKMQGRTHTGSSCHPLLTTSLTG